MTLVSVALAALPANAQPPPPPPARSTSPADAAAPAAPSAEEKAREHYKRGLELFDDGDFALALVEFERAHTIVPSFRLLFNIGQVHFQMAHYAKARLALEEYLREGKDAVTAERRAEVERDLATLSRRTATLAVRTNVTDAEVSINEHVVGKGSMSKSIVDAGQLRIDVRREGFVARTTQVTLAGGDDQTVQVDLVAVERPAALPEKSGLSRATISWIATGVLAAGAAGTGIATLLTANKYDDARRAPITGSPQQAQADLESRRNVVDALSITTDAIAGAAVIGAGISLYFTLHDRPSAPAAQVRPTGRGLLFEGTF